MIRLMHTNSNVGMEQGVTHLGVVDFENILRTMRIGQLTKNNENLKSQGSLPWRGETKWGGFR